MTKMVSSRLITRLAPRFGASTTWRRLLASKAPDSGEKNDQTSQRASTRHFEPTRVKLSGESLKTRLEAKDDVITEGTREAVDLFSAPFKRDINFPYYTDVVIIGGGAIGASIAYNMKNMHSKLNIVVVEKDPTVRNLKKFHIIFHWVLFNGTPGYRFMIPSS